MGQPSDARGVRPKLAKVTYPIRFDTPESILKVVTLGPGATYIQSGVVMSRRTAEGWATFPPEHPVFTDHWPKFPILPSWVFREMVGQTGMLLLVHLGQERAQELTPMFRSDAGSYSTTDSVRPGQLVAASVRLIRSSWLGDILTGTIYGTCSFNHPSRGPTEVANLRVRFEAIPKLKLNGPVGAGA